LVHPLPESSGVILDAKQYGASPVDQHATQIDVAQHFRKVGARAAASGYQPLCSSESRHSQAALSTARADSAKLENQTSRPITVCVQFGQWSPKGDTIESTPSPFFVERNDNGKWRFC
jgi:type II secretory pathway component PulJ